MTSVYILLKANQITQALLNFSLSQSIDACPKITITKPLLYFFEQNTEYHIVEYTREVALRTPSLYDHKWFTKEEIIALEVENT